MNAEIQLLKETAEKLRKEKEPLSNVPGSPEIGSPEIAKYLKYVDDDDKAG